MRALASFLHVLALVCFLVGESVCVARDQELLPLPDVPRELTAPKERATYIVRHFWDEMDFSDARRSCDAEFVERHFSTYASLFDHCPEKILPGAVKCLMKRAEVSAQAWMTLAEVAEKYLYEPQSPVFSERHYLIFVEQFLHSKLLSASQKEVYRFQKKSIKMNAPGKRAADFRYADETGKARRMRSIRSDILLIIFFDPSCGYCVKTNRRIRDNEAIIRATDEERLKILHVDINKTCLDGLYLIEAMPSLYLLDGRKKVILKNATVEEIQSFLTE